jgi:hypothetical protein
MGINPMTRSKGWMRRPPDKPAWLLRWEKGDFTDTELDDMLIWLRAEQNERLIDAICQRVAMRSIRKV